MEAGCMVGLSTDMPEIHLNPIFPAFAAAASVGGCPVYALVFRSVRSVLDPVDSIDSDPGTRSATVCSPETGSLIGCGLSDPLLSTPHFQYLAARPGSDGRGEYRSATMAMQGRSYVDMCARAVPLYILRRAIIGAGRFGWDLEARRLEGVTR